ncbi:unnamed protein product [Gongylonema pulchrum]|uniref:Uncharacterized protein n=1 Tax=Gongylonema pulchrum TaxID=637853 RepID=A0A183E6U5_9BILA|nr:unnamed protein product [Gongylonema pulchrum]
MQQQQQQHHRPWKLSQSLLSTLIPQSKGNQCGIAGATLSAAAPAAQPAFPGTIWKKSFQPSSEQEQQQQQQKPNCTCATHIEHLPKHQSSVSTDESPEQECKQHVVVH